MRHHVLTILLAAPLVAQSPVSPANRATSAGNSASALPFGNPQPMRYLQLHSDLPPGPLAIRGLSWRQNEGNGTFSGTRSIDIELRMGRGVRADIAKFLFAANYPSGAPSVVLARRTVNFGPQGAAGNPSPFQGMSVTLDTPFTYTSGTLAWEARIFGGTNSGTLAAADAELAPRNTSTDATFGLGCTLQGNQDPMRLDTTSIGIGNSTYYATFVRSAPANAPLVLAFGATNPNLPVPGLCCNSFTDLASILGFGSTAADGTFTANGNSVLFLQRDLAGVTLHAQAFAFDASSTQPIQLLGSNGATTTFAAPNGLFGSVSRIYALGDPTALVAPYDGDMVGFGLVTRFDT
jgi:hypothetical protein